jgi:uncharacterized SAM-binding protein YcdF (DUF218 family)
LGPRASHAAVGAGLGLAAGFLADALSLQSAVSYWGPMSPVVLAAGGLGALLWPSRGRPVLVAALALVAALWLLVAFTPLTHWMARGLVRKDALRDADAVVVLASRLQKDGEMTSAAMSRLLHGLELLGEQRARRLVLTELEPPSRSYAEPARALMAALRIEVEVLTVGPVRNTRSEAVQVAELLRRLGLRTVILVTSPTHTRRAAAAFEKAGLVVLSSPAAETRFDLETLDESDDRVQAFGSLLHERVGWLVYAMRGHV